MSRQLGSGFRNHLEQRVIAHPGDGRRIFAPAQSPQQTMQLRNLRSIGSAAPAPIGQTGRRWWLRLGDLLEHLLQSHIDLGHGLLVDQLQRVGIDAGLQQPALEQGDRVRLGLDPQRPQLRRQLSPDSVGRVALDPAQSRQFRFALDY